ncbi:MAG: PilZ domain-containing protein [Nevskia sp.]|nr:PilZ domain-containing protein [Nevskia sp.]
MNAQHASSTWRTKERRVEHRLHYPADLRPVLSIGPREWEVLDISEYGIRLAWPGSGEITPSQRFRATVHFLRSQEQTIIGTIVRTSSHDIGARLEHGFDFDIIARQHDFVMSCSL